MTEYNISKLVKHSGKMLLLDRVIDHGDDWLIAEVDLTHASMFVHGGLLDAFIVIEYMAQSIAALAGLRAKNKHQEIKIGLLLGTRKFLSNVSAIAVGSKITIRVEEKFAEENGLAVFECAVTTKDVSISCNLNVYHVDDIGEFKV